jgi:hypothetical protein
MVGIDINTIQNAIPSNLKKQGMDKLSGLVVSKGEEIKTQIQPKLLQLVEEAKSPNLCANPNTVKSIIETRNNIIGKLNNTSTFLDQSTLALTGINTLFTLLTTTKIILSTTRIATSLGSKFAPIIPGAVVALIDDLRTAEDAITYDSLGESNLAKLKNILGGASIAFAVISSSIKTAILTLNSLDLLISKCPNATTLSTVDNNLVQIANQEEKAALTNNEVGYKGFILQIDTVPYTDTVNRKKAVGINQNGIKLIETELSFTQNEQTLIDELKFIIDRDNLKAN